jgi:3-hydroxyisobutyrate dehydrogenase-like beta-hydroxyacid dehydrogenase
MGEARWDRVARVHLLVRTHDQAAAALEQLDLLAGDDTPVHVHTTLAPGAAAELVGRARTHIRVLEQPITGGAVGIRAGRVTVLSAGPADTRDRDWIGHLAEHVLTFDRLGQPTLAKLINNTVAAATTRATVGMLGVAAEHGLDLGVMRAVLRHGSGGSWMAEAVADLGEDQARLLVKDVRLLQEQVGELPTIRLDDEALMLSGLAALQASLADLTERP